MKIKNRFFFLTASAGICIGILAGAFLSLSHDLPQINQLKQYKPSAVTSVYSADRHLISQFYSEKRFPVSIKDIPDHLKSALLTIEDRNFYSHSGLHFKAILRAIVHDIKARSFKQGASTLTQQLAKTLFLSNEKSIVRKIKEAILSLQIERRYTKDEILELYLNQIYLGSGSYGVEAACQTYFNKSVSDITLPEAALIAGLPKAPSIYSPKKNPDRALMRRNTVLHQMLLTQQITRDQYDKAKKTGIKLPPKKQNKYETGYFVEYIKKILDKNFNLNQIYTQGLHVHTTLNLEYQKTASLASVKGISAVKQRMEAAGKDSSKVQCAIIGIENRTGGILCMIGGNNFSKSPFNRATQAMRQPGSAFKPFIYAEALAQGYSQATILLDAPLTYHPGTRHEWTVNNFTRTFSGEMTCRKALALSKNTPVVRLLDKLEPHTVISFARKAGITTSLSPTLSLALGTYETKLIDLTSSYIPFANQGIKTEPFGIEKITDANFRVIYQHSVTKKRIMPRENAAVMSDMLKAVIREGTGKQARVIKKDIAGKTGTTDSYKDSLFIGFSPDVAMGVWVGNDDSKTLGKNETGARAALPIWIECIQSILIDRPVQYFDIPDRTKMIYINPDTGLNSGIQSSGTVKTLIRTKG